MLFTFNTGLHQEYIDLINDIILYLIFIFLIYIISDYNIFKDVTKVLFLFIIIKHLLLTKILLVS
jgi:hypothetical protein